MSVELEQDVWALALEVGMFRLASLREYAERNIDYQCATEIWIRSRQTMKVFFASRHFPCAFFNWKTLGGNPTI